MHKLRTLVLISATGALMIPTVVLAQPKADLNGDGTVTKAEFITHAEKKFAKADLDFDGVWSASERKTMRDSRRKERMNRRFAKLDQNSDGVISKAELEAAEQKRSDRRDLRRSKQLKKFDTDGDGIISQTEKEAAKEKRRIIRAQRREIRKNNKRLKRVRLDSNSDGLISQTEFIAHADALFTRMDANGDGVLTKGEGRKARHKKHSNKRF